MTEKEFANPFSFLIDSFWASLPEQTANDLAGFKKDVLTGFRKAVDTFVDEEILRTDSHLDNARRMREQYKQEAEGGESQAA